MKRTSNLFASLALPAALAISSDARADEPSPGAPPPSSLLAPPFGPEELEYERDRPVPPGYVVASRKRTPLLVAGLVTGGLGVASFTAGVILAEATRPEECPETIHGCFSDGQFIGLGFAALGGAAFVTGGVLALVGLTSKKVYRRADLASARAPRLAVVPVAGGRSGGLVVSGAF